MQNIITGIHEGDLAVVSDIWIKGIVTGTVFVKSGSLVLNGTVQGSVHFMEGSTGEIHGIIQGNLANEGGDVRVYGIVRGTLMEKSGTTLVDPKAIVGK